MKTVKSRLFKKYLKIRKSQARFCLSLGWLNISKKKFENYDSVGAGAHKVVFGPTLTLVFLIFGKCEIGKLHIFKKSSLRDRYYKEVEIKIL